MTRSDKFPFTDFGKTYGFKPGKYSLKTVHGPPAWKPAEDERLLVQVSDDGCYGEGDALGAPSGIVCHWLWSRGEWVRITWDVLLDPLNLRLRREFNEELAKHRDDKVDVKLKKKSHAERYVFINDPDAEYKLNHRFRHHVDHKTTRFKGGWYCYDCDQGMKISQHNSFWKGENHADNHRRKRR